MTKVFLIRHAEAEGNLYRRMHGHYDGLITGKGYMQIEALRNRFLNEKIDAVYSSDLKRARTTAKAIYEAHNLPVHTTEHLREVKMGVWEGEAWGHSSYFDPEMSEHFNNDPAKWKVEGSESYENVCTRMRKIISEISRNHDGETVAIFSHGFVIRAFACEISNLKSHEINQIQYCDNTGVTLLHYGNDSFDMQYYGDTSHFQSDISTLKNQSWWREKQHRVSDNVRFEEFNEKRDMELLELCGAEFSKKVNSGKMFTALQVDTPIGILGIDAEANAEEKIGKIDIIFVKSELRRSSYGVQLLGLAVTKFRKRGLEKLQITVADSSPAMSFCQKYGFVKKEQKEDSTYLMEKGLLE